MQIMIAIIGLCAAAMLLWYVYILMKGVCKQKVKTQMKKISQ